MARGATTLLTTNRNTMLSCNPKADLNRFEKVQMIQRNGAASQDGRAYFHLLDGARLKSTRKQGVEANVGPRRAHDQGSKERPSGATAPARILTSRPLCPNLS